MAERPTAQGGRPRVLHLVTRSQPRGAESAAVMLAAALTERGFDSRVVALAPGDPATLAGVPALGTRTLSPRTLLRLRREVRNADVVIAHGSRTLPAVVAASVGLRRRLVYQNIGDPLFWAHARLRRARVRLLLGRMTAVAALTDTAAAVLTTHFAVPGDRLRTIRNMRDGTRFRPPEPGKRREHRARHGLSEDECVVAVVGALSPEKRVELALEVAAPLAGTAVLVAGDGPERPGLDRLVDARRWERIRFLGAVDDVVPVLHASDVLLMTSESEGVPGVLIEAGMCGVPAVSTDVGYVGEVVDDGVTGRLVGSARPAEIRAALQDVLSRREEMGAAARDRCLARFDLERVVDDWAHLLGQLLSEPPRRPWR